MDPSDLSVTELVAGLRAGAAGSYDTEAGVELLIRHWTWLATPGFVRECVTARDPDGDLLDVDWTRVAACALAPQADPAPRAVALIAVQLAGYPKLSSEPVSLGTLPPLAWLLRTLSRRDVDLVLAAISHATGTHHQVHHLGEPDPDGTWHVTSTSPRLRPGPLHDWPPPPLPGLD
ncbi:hypothetical protein [Cellulomonas triticagri]|uniref:Uncharacterized protein n=1 Tax=Cellulomonas triticagri TaxID=2483352 RepID=A0A3M2JN49_9CELL|nr:hypothetical protein [Cellulomonas triticagri]RMI13240.1 hypothetical protein EBM89_05295 [Cellulomonas triticagri]